MGLNEVVILQQVHFRLLISKYDYDGHKWIYNSYPEWHNEFPVWSERTIMRTTMLIALQQEEINNTNLALSEITMLIVGGN